MPEFDELSFVTYFPYGADGLRAAEGETALAVRTGCRKIAMGLLLYMLAVPHLSSAEIALISILEIIFGVVSTWMFVGERPSDAALAGGAVVIGALVANHLVGMRQAPPVAV